MIAANQRPSTNRLSREPDRRVVLTELRRYRLAPISYNTVVDGYQIFEHKKHKSRRCRVHQLGVAHTGSEQQCMEQCIGRERFPYLRRRRAGREHHGGAPEGWRPCLEQSHCRRSPVRPRPTRGADHHPAPGRGYATANGISLARLISIGAEGVNTYVTYFVVN